MDLTAVFSDDQLAVLGCFAALAVCGLIAATSFHFGPEGQKRRNSSHTAGRIVPVVNQTSDHASEDRRAA